MADEVGHNGEMLSHNLAVAIAADLGMEATEESIEPLTDACHRFLEAGVADTVVQDTLSELLSELRRSGSLSTEFEEDGFDDVAPDYRYREED